MPHNMYTVIYAGDIVVQTSGMYACNTMLFLAHIINLILKTVQISCRPMHA